LDENELRRMLLELKVYAAHGPQDTVPTATGSDGKKVGAWTRAGAPPSWPR
jgi:hypothetical protein